MNKNTAPHFAIAEIYDESGNLQRKIRGSVAIGALGESIALNSAKNAIAHSEIVPRIHALQSDFAKSTLHALEKEMGKTPPQGPYDIDKSVLATLSGDIDTAIAHLFKKSAMSQHDIVDAITLRNIKKYAHLFLDMPNQDETALRLS